MLIVGVLATMSCGKPAIPTDAGPYVLRLDARSAGSYEGRGQAAWVRDVLSSQLEQARWFRDSGDGTELSARLSYEERRSEDGVPILRAYLLVEPDADLATALDAIGVALDAHVELERRDQTIDLRRDLPIAVERALALLDAKITIARSTADEVALLLDDDDPEVVLIALDGVERRRLHALDDRVHAVLDHDEERVAMRAVECLGVIGGPEHAPALLRAARLADRAHAFRLYEALAKLGGQHARGFLEFAARNEDDPELATRAEQALAQLEAQEPSTVLDPVARGHRQ